MGKFKEKLKGRRQSKNVIDARNDSVSQVIATDTKGREDKDLQVLKGKLSVHLRDKTPMAEQKSDSFTKFNNEKRREPDRMLARAKKLIRLGDDVFPKEFSKPFK